MDRVHSGQAAVVPTEQMERAVVSSPYGWLIKDFADGWFWTDRAATAEAMMQGGHVVHSLAAMAFGWPQITPDWIDAYCELTGRDPEGGSVSFIGDGPVSTSFRDAARREIDAVLCAAPKSAIRSLTAALNSEQSAAVNLLLVENARLTRERDDYQRTADAETDLRQAMEVNLADAESRQISDYDRGNALFDAFVAGANQVHKYWTENPGEPPRGDPEFSEAARDYVDTVFPPNIEGKRSPMGRVLK